MDIPQWQLSSVVSEKQRNSCSENPGDWLLLFFFIFKTVVHKKQHSQQKRVQSYQKHVRVFTLNNNSTWTTSSYFVLMFSFLTLTIKTTDKDVFKVTKKRVKQGFNLFRVNKKKHQNGFKWRRFGVCNSKIKKGCYKLSKKC